MPAACNLLARPMFDTTNVILEEDLQCSESGNEIEIAGLNHYEQDEWGAGSTIKERSVELVGSTPSFKKAEIWHRHWWVMFIKKLG